VDAVVRDGSGHPLTNLSATDFEVFEDGVRQTVDSFSRITHGGGIGVGVAWRDPARSVTVNPTEGAEPATAAGGPQEDAATVALVFDHLSADALSLAQKATLDYVPLSGDSPVRVGVFAGDIGARVLQFYTTDRHAVRQAVARIAPLGLVDERREERADELLARRRAIDEQNTSAVASLTAAGGAAMSRGASDIGQREMERALIQTEMTMTRAYDSFDRSQKGNDTASVLADVVRSLALYPGRKTVVLFSEGLPVTPALSARLDSLIDTANRANVTVYAVDAKGLRASSGLMEARKEMTNFVEERAQQNAAGIDRTTEPISMAFERVQDTISLQSRSGLAKLAGETGGFLTEQSNDLSSAFKRIDEDNQFHYLLTYSPRNTSFDGRFHAIRVEVKRSGAHVFARKGYRALRRSSSGDTGGYELPALEMLDRAPLPNAFPVQAAAFSFPAPDRPGLSPVAVRVPTSSLQFSVDGSRATYSAQAAVVVRIRDDNGTPVETLSQQYVLTGDAKDVDAAKKGEILFYREPDLLPGVYTVESIVFDAVTRRGSARLSTLTVPRVDAAAPAMSSLVLVSRIEETSDAAPVASPLAVGHTLLYPNLGEPIDNAPSRELPFFFTLYGSAPGAAASVQLMRDGRVLADAPLQLGDPSGSRVQHVGRFPIGKLPPGTYQLRITVGDLSRTAYFTLR
jgi:VWFA-related protein